MQGPEQTTTTGSVAYSMPGQHKPPGDYSLYALPVILLLFALRAWRGARERPLRIERMLIAPAIFAIMIGLSIWQQPPPPSVAVYAVLLVAFVLGIGLGWFRGRMVKVSVDVETHALTSQVSPWGVIILAAIMLARIALRGFLESHEADWHISPAALTDAFLLFFGGSLIGRITEIWIRANRLLKGARAAKSAGKAVPDEVSEDHA